MRVCVCVRARKSYMLFNEDVVVAGQHIGWMVNKKNYRTGMSETSYNSDDLKLGKKRKQFYKHEMKQSLYKHNFFAPSK